MSAAVPVSPDRERGLWYEHSSDRLVRLGRAVIALSRELAASQRELATLRRQNTDLGARIAELESELGGRG
jgi:cell division protein FtsB